MSPLAEIRRKYKRRPWHSTESDADKWEAIRQRMTPRPTPAQFLRWCDDYQLEAHLTLRRPTHEQVYAYVEMALLTRHDTN